MNPTARTTSSPAIANCIMHKALPAPSARRSAAKTARPTQKRQTNPTSSPASIDGPPPHPLAKVINALGQPPATRLVSAFTLPPSSLSPEVFQDGGRVLGGLAIHAVGQADVTRECETGNASVFGSSLDEIVCPASCFFGKRKNTAFFDL